MSGYLERKKRLSVPDFVAMKKHGEKITMVTAYDYTMASIINGTDIDVILVGDSAANVMLGCSSTIPITLDEMIIFARSVVRGAKDKLIICDMPFGSYHAGIADAVMNAVRIMKETGCDALKLEGGAEIVPVIKSLVATGIPVMGHLGLTPQSVNLFGGYGLRAKGEDEAQLLLKNASELEAAGCFGIVLEKIPALLAGKVTEKVNIPTIGIGGGNGTDGQVLVLQDVLGMNAEFSPKFLRKYADLYSTITEALTEYGKDVKSGVFPSEKEAY